MSEANFSRHTSRCIKKASVDSHIQRHEDKITPGIPDRSYAFSNGASGWIEDKYIKNWPKNLNKKFKISNLTNYQKNWLQTRGELIGNCFVFVKIGKSDYFLFSWDQIDKFETYNWSDLKTVAVGYWGRIIDYEELVEKLSGNI